MDEEKITSFKKQFLSFIISSKQDCLMLAKNSSPNRIKELDALRGIAAVLVVLFHYNLMLGEKANGILKLGVTGVDLFFIISGFVIFMSISKINNGLDFVINRISRLYPAYWACVTITFLALFFYRNETLTLTKIFQYFANMTMFQFYFRVDNIDASYWTMIIEMIFYICILILFQKKLLKHLNVIGISLCILTALSTNFAYQVNIVSKLIRYIPFLQFTPLFFAGTIFYKIYTQNTNLIKNISLLLLSLGCQISLFNYSGASRFYLNHTEYGCMLLIYFSVFLLFVFRRLNFIVSEFTLFLGDISFSLYLIHQALSTEVIIPFLTKHLQINFWVAAIIITLPLIILLAAIISYRIEKPLSKKMKNRLRNIFTKSNKIAQPVSI